VPRTVGALLLVMVVALVLVLALLLVLRRWCQRFFAVGQAPARACGRTLRAFAPWLNEKIRHSTAVPIHSQASFATI